MKNHITIFFLLVVSPVLVFAQTPKVWSAVEIQQNLQKLPVLGSVLYIAAHPDDENTRLLGYLAREKHYKTGYLSLTRGDGGQNLIGNEQGVDLGLIRTQELLAARRIDGASQFFTRAYDFGFSKTASETLKIWDKELVLSDVVWVIRKFQPDVIITRFPGDERAGHGHHAASSLLAQEAFKAAADAKRFPEQLQYVKLWQAKSILWNTFNFGGNNTTSEDQLKIDVGVFNPLMGKGYGEIAAESRSQHRSQGFGVPAQRGKSFEYFTLLDGEPIKKELLENIKTDFGRVTSNDQLSAKAKTITEQFNPLQPQKSVESLIDFYKLLQALPNSSWKDQKLEETQLLIAACAGIFTELIAQKQYYGAKQPLEANFQAINRNNLTVKILSYHNVTVDKQMMENEPLSFPIKFNNDQLTQPYWLNTAVGKGNFTVEDLQKIGLAENSAAQIIEVKFNIAGVEIPLKVPLSYKFTDQVLGEIYQPVVVAPNVTANFSSKVYVFNNLETKKISVQLKAFADAESGFLSLNAPGYLVSPQKVPVKALKENEAITVTFDVKPLKNSPEKLSLSLNISLGNEVSQKGLKQILYEHIPAINYFPTAQATALRLNYNPINKKIAYLEGAGDQVAEVLKQSGFLVTVIAPANINSYNLSDYDAVVTGVRFFNVAENASSIQSLLLDYVKNGGTLLVQYNVNQPLKTQQIGPYPFRISRTRVTEEDAKITINQPGQSVFNEPFKITDKDFDGWIQERGLYFLTDIDPKYQKLFTMNDSGEPATDGSTIMATYGKGKFVYTGLAFFRELPAGVPGALKLFINLLGK